MEHIKNILADICKADLSRWSNERYLHHYFSQQMQQFYPVGFANPKLHPEWKTQGRYNKECKPDDAGAQWRFDFAIECCNCKDNAALTAIEFKFIKEGWNEWNGKEVAYDYTKLLDKRNIDVKRAISLSIVRLPKELTKGGDLTRLTSIAIFKEMLGSNMATDRPFLFLIAEKYKEEVCLWYFNDLNKTEFQPAQVNDLLTLI